MLELLKPYLAYKDSGLEWLGEVPEHWEVQRIKHYLSINESTLGEDTSPDFTFDYIDIGSVGTGFLLTAPHRIQFHDSPSRARRVVREGDTLFSTVRTYLKAVWHADTTQFNLIASTGFVVLTPRKASFPKFVSYFCQCEPFTDWISANSVGVTYPAIPETKFATFDSVVPPFVEQEAIAHFLDHTTNQIDRLIQANEKLIELLREQKQATIHEAVTGRIDVRTRKPYAKYKDSGVEWLGDVPEHWNVAFVKRNYTVRLGKMLQSQRRGAGDREVRYLKAKNVQWTGIDWTTVDSMFATVSELDQYGVSAGDLLVCEGGEGGRCAMVEALDGANPCIIQNALHRVRPRTNGNKSVTKNNWLKYALRTVSSKGWLDVLNDKATIAHFTAEKFGALQVPKPPFCEQSAIVHFLAIATNQIEQSIRARAKNIELLREYRTRLVSDAVTGKIDVRTVVADSPDSPLKQAKEINRSESNLTKND